MTHFPEVSWPLTYLKQKFLFSPEKVNHVNACSFLLSQKKKKKQKKNNKQALWFNWWILCAMLCRFESLHQVKFSNVIFFDSDPTLHVLPRLWCGMGDGKIKVFDATTWNLESQFIQTKHVVVGYIYTFLEVHFSLVNLISYCKSIICGIIIFVLFVGRARVIKGTKVIAVIKRM